MEEISRAKSIQIILPLQNHIPMRGLLMELDKLNFSSVLFTKKIKRNTKIGRVLKRLFGSLDYTPL